MKKLTNQLLVLFFVMAMIGCNKTEVLTVKNPEKLDTYSVPVLQFDGKDKSNGILVGSKKELLEIIKTDGFSLVKSASNVNKVFIPGGTGVKEPRDPSDPSTNCWNEINAAYQAIYPEALAVANSRCEDVFICVGCPSGGLWAIMVVSPTSIKCIEVFEADAQISVFNSSGGFDGKDVAEYINRLRSKY